jgi:hypothetical protein
VTLSLILALGFTLAIVLGNGSTAADVTTGTTTTVPPACSDSAECAHWRYLAHKRQRGWVRANRHIIRLRSHLRQRTGPSVDHAITLASRVFGVPESQMRAVSFCESRWDPYATNGKYRGLFQLGWAPFGLSPFDPYASALSAAMTVRHDGSWRQWSCKP